MSSPPTLFDRTSRPDYLIRVCDTVLRVEAAADPLEAVELLEEAGARLGADAAVFVSSMRDNETRASRRYLFACDPSWPTEYERHVGADDDPWLAYAASHSEPIRATELDDACRGGSRVMAFADDLGFRSTTIIPISNAEYSRLGALYVGSNTQGFFESAGYPTFKIGARLLATELQAWWLTYLRNDLLARTRVTAEEIFLLAEERRGVQTKRIARNLGVSPPSVHSRFQRINAKFQVRNKTDAARLAAEYGLI